VIVVTISDPDIHAAARRIPGGSGDVYSAQPPSNSWTNAAWFWIRCAGAGYLPWIFPPISFAGGDQPVFANEKPG